MATKPATLPRWADVGGSIATPPSGKQDVGWVVGDAPPAQYFNWLHYWGYQWLVWISSYFASSGEFTVGSSAEAVLTPVAMFNDYKGKSRQHIDHLGYLAGQVSNWYEQWRTSGTTEPTGWTFSGTQTRAYSDPDANMPYRNVALSLAASASVNATIVTSNIAYVDNGRAFVAECDVRTGASNWSGSNALKFQWQLKFAGGNRIMGFAMDRSVNANIQTVVSGFVAYGVADDTFNTAVAVAVSTTYRLRMEIIGSSLSSQAAGTYTCRFYVNGALVRTFTVASGADLVQHQLVLSNAGTALAGAVQVGPIRSSWNHRLDQDAL